MILLDTNALLFYLFKADQLSDAAMNTITYSDEAWVSIASFWDIAIKNSIGKLELKCSVSEMAEKMSIVTRDTIIPKYPVNVIW